MITVPQRDPITLRQATEIIRAQNGSEGQIECYFKGKGDGSVVIRCENKEIQLV